MIEVNLRKIPEKPGIYIFKDKDQVPLYIGKAKNLRKRISFYFKSDSLKVKELLQAANHLEFLETQTEAEAIFKESDLIKRFNPPFNQLLRDDTSYFYIVFTKHNFPKVIITHQPHRFEVYKQFGPFTEGSSLKTLLRIIRKRVPFCTCLEAHLRECLNSQLGLCHGYCCLKNTEIDDKKRKNYFDNLGILEEILKGNFNQLKKDIIGRMEVLVNDNKISEAAEMKNIYLAVKKIEEEIQILQPDSFYIENIRKKILLELKEKLNLRSVPRLIEIYDISHLSGDFKVGVLVSFFDGFYNPQRIRKFKIKTVLKSDDPKMIYEVLKRRLKHSEWGLPDLILVDGGKTQFKYAYSALEEMNLADKIGIISFAKPSREIFYALDRQPLRLNLFSLATQNFIKLIDLKAHQFVLKYHRKLREK